MPRKLRIESRENIYHVINRGNHRSAIFGTEEARDGFAATLAEAAVRNSWQVFAYCILSNQYHLCLATPKGNLSEGMRWLQATFATRFKRLRRESGHVFQGRFKSLLVEPGLPLFALVNYLHLVPLRAGLESPKDLGTYRWSSWQLFPKRKNRPGYLDCAWLHALEKIDDSPGGWTTYKKVLRQQAADDPKEIAKLETAMNRGWCIGSPAFKKAIAVKQFKKSGATRMSHGELKEFNQLQWEHALSLSLKALKKSGTDLTKDRFSASWKLAIASKMKRETSVPNQWLSEHLRMGHPNGVSSICGVYQRKQEAQSPDAKRLRVLSFGH